MSGQLQHPFNIHIIQPWMIIILYLFSTGSLISIHYAFDLGPSIFDIVACVEDLKN